jgi:hypothetical protein
MSQTSPRGIPVSGGSHPKRNTLLIARQSEESLHKMFKTRPLVMGSELSPAQMDAALRLERRDELRILTFHNQIKGRHPRAYGYFELYGRTWKPWEHAFIERFDNRTAQELAKKLRKPIDKYKAKSLMHSLRRRGLKEDEARAVITLAYPEYYMAAEALRALPQNRGATESL